MQKSEAEAIRYNGTVAMWFSSHHQIDPRDWNNIEEFGGHYHPSLGYYKSDDPEVLRKHLHWIRRTGADAIVYDCFGFGQWNLTDLPKDKVLSMLVKLLGNQEGESRKLKLIIWLEKWNSNPSVEQYRYALNYVREHFAHLDFYFHYKGKPLVVTYHNGNNEAIDEIEFENEFFELRRIRPYISDVWAYVDAYPQRLKREWMPASPGFNSFLEEAYIEKYVHKVDSPDLEAIRQRCPKAEREDGLFFENQLLRARKVNPNFIFLSGWNDWQYACQIEPAVEYGFKYVDLSARLLGRETETVPYREDDNGLSA